VKCTSNCQDHRY